MQVTENAWCNFTYLGPTPDIGDLPCRRETVDGTSVVRAYYRPSEEDLEQLNRGGTIVLGIWGMEPIPPVSLGIEFPPENVGPVDSEPRPQPDGGRTHG